MKEKVGIDFFAKAAYLSNLAERNGVFYAIIKRADLERNAYDSDLYRIAGGKAERLTTSRDVQAFSLTDEGILFASLREEKDKEAQKNGEPLTVFQLLPYDGGEAREALRLAHAVQQAEWLGGGRLLFRATLDHALERFKEENGGDLQKAAEARKKEAESVTVLDEVPFWFNGMGIINKARIALYYYDGEKVKRLSDPHASVSELKLNPAKTRALCTQKVYADVMPREDALLEVDIESGTLAPVNGWTDGMIDGYAYAGEDSALVLYTEVESPYGNATNPTLYRVDLKSGEKTLLDDSYAYNYHDSVGSDLNLGTRGECFDYTDEALTFLATLGGDCHIMRYDTETGGFSQVTKVPGKVQECIPYRGGYAMLAMRGQKLGELYLVDRDGKETQATDVNGELLEKTELVCPVEISFEGKEGTEIHGWVMPPVGYVPGKQYPTILDIHGGPKTVYGNALFHEMQYWCAQGYAVIFCNPTGGDGRGSGFADIRGKYGTVDYEDIMQFADEAIRRFGFIDAANMGVTGGSYGGFMTNWIIGHTDRFRAAASQRSISNWVGFYGTSDIGHTFGNDQIQATPWEGHKAMWAASPLKYADKVKTPTLFIHSEEDYRCSMFEGLQMFYALKIHGVETRMCLFKGENHELSRSGKPKNRIRRLEEITKWMDKHLK